MKEIIMPDLGTNTNEVTVSKWLKKPGDTVAKHEPLLEVETDKATLEVESYVEGTLAEVLAAPGDEVPVGETIAHVDENDG